jgi:hypothetical protein
MPPKRSLSGWNGTIRRQPPKVILENRLGAAEAIQQALGERDIPAPRRDLRHQGFLSGDDAPAALDVLAGLGKFDGF